MFFPIAPYFWNGFDDNDLKFIDTIAQYDTKV